jgi:hypothetical protein
MIPPLSVRTHAILPTFCTLLFLPVAWSCTLQSRSAAAIVVWLAVSVLVDVPHMLLGSTLCLRLVPWPG